MKAKQNSFDAEMRRIRSASLDKQARQAAKAKRSAEIREAEAALRARLRAEIHQLKGVVA